MNLGRTADETPNRARPAPHDMPPKRSSKPYDKRSLVTTLPDDDLDLLYQWKAWR